MFVKVSELFYCLFSNVNFVFSKFILGKLNKLKSTFKKNLPRSNSMAYFNFQISLKNLKPGKIAL